MIEWFYDYMFLPGKNKVLNKINKIEYDSL